MIRILLLHFYYHRMYDHLLFVMCMVRILTIRLLAKSLV